MKKTNFTNYENVSLLADKIISGYSLSCEEAYSLWGTKTDDIINAARRIRSHFKQQVVKLCGIVNAKSGDCSEDCGFCAQSVHNKADVMAYPLLKKEEIVAFARQAIENRATCYGIVTSGDFLTDDEFNKIVEAVVDIRKMSINVSVSIGRLTRERIKKLKAAGVSLVHHNLETSERYFPQICSTHKYSDRINTVYSVIEEGLEVCCGGLIGIGETFKDRIDLAFTLKKTGIKSVPLNIFDPVKGTRFSEEPQITEEDILKTIALFRFIMPEADIRVCGGREKNLGRMQARIFDAGANGMMVGGYLTTKGRSVSDDIKMIEGSGMQIAEMDNHG